MLDATRLQTPVNDGEVLIEPAASEWSNLLEANRKRSDRDAVELAGVSVGELRHSIRSNGCGGPGRDPLIMTGHQPEFVHPGVWAKHVVVRAITERHGLYGCDLVVDNHAPNSALLMIPSSDAEGYVSTVAVETSEAVSGSAYEGRAALPPTHIERIRQQAEEALATGDITNPLIARYCSGFAADESPTDFVDQHLAGRAAIDTELEVDLQEIRVSRSFGGHFVADLLLHAGRFAEAYNHALADYRQRHRVRGTNRPIPDLQQTDDRTEAALWLYLPQQPRQRMWVRQEGDTIEIFAGQKRAGTLKADDLKRDPNTALASLLPWLCRPRALTLTLWARLLLCDLFVHGIGGAKYDRITDAILRSYYGCEPPAYACVSATLRLPLPRFDVTRDGVLSARQRRRDFRFNPQRYLSEPPAELIERRARLIRRSDELRERQASQMERRQTFQAIRRINAELCATGPQVASRFEQDVELLSRQLESNRIAESREYFYAFQPRERLVMLADRLRSCG
jgi:hypothetical protein